MQSKRPYTPTRNMVRQLEEEKETDDSSLDSTETFQINTVNAIGDSQLVISKIKNGNFLRFQLDTGAQFNVLPLHIYKAVKKDVSLKDLTAATTSSIISFGGTRHPVIGQVKLNVWRGTYTCYLMSKYQTSNYNIKLHPTVHRVQHVPRGVPVAIRDKVKAALDDLVKKEVIGEVKRPTELIYSMVTP